MTLSQKIAAALDENTRALAPPCTASTEAGPHRLSVDLTALDAVGVAFSSLEFATSSKPEWTTDALKAWAGNLASRVTYLLEPLKIVEVDNDEGEVQVRSQSPTPRADRRNYYEARLNRTGSLHLERIAFDETTRRRQPATCHLTREVLERLVDDIVASIP